MRLNQYSSKENMIFKWFTLPYTLVINLLLFGTCIYRNLPDFLTSFLVSLLYFTLIYFLFSAVAKVIKRRFPEDSALFRRIGVMMPLFFIMNVITVQGLYMVYAALDWTSCQPIQQMQWWVTGFGVIASIVITFFNEAAVGWDKWKASITESEQLKNAYRKSKLLGLKGQVNPHFLFNCFNSLSSLINEDQEAAEKFLDEMTKVHRYMLRGDEEQLVSLETELKFAASYLYLVRARFGDAIQANLSCIANQEPGFLPALSLQVIFENIIYGNAASRAKPLVINLRCEHGNLVIHHSIHPKTRGNDADPEDGLDNLLRKYQLLHDQPVTIKEGIAERTIVLPLFQNKEVTL
jgi:two-component system, LytTR family, sensor kinase